MGGVLEEERNEDDDDEEGSELRSTAATVLRTLWT
jgi:hypothetical protein